MSTAARFALDFRTHPWFLLIAFATTLPHALHQPIWLTAAALAIIAAATWLWGNNRRLPGRWVIFLLVAAGTAATFIQYRTLFGREAGVALLVLMMALKTLELHHQRDGFVVALLGYFLLLTHYFESQEMLTGLWLLACLWLITSALVRLAGKQACPPRLALREGAVLCLQALPFLIVLYLLFPRISGPLWGMPRDAFSGKTGLSDTMSPGKISSLANNTEIAFRVHFDGQPPAKRQLYWRGPVLEYFDGDTWMAVRESGSRPQVIQRSAEISYEMTIEPHHRQWLLALDAPSRLPPQALIDNRLTVVSKARVINRMRLEFSAALDYRLNVDEAPSILRRNLQLPGNGNPQAQALGRRWRDELGTPEKIIAQALTLFNSEFRYSLSPPLLGSNGIDDFLFSTKTGFCEHFSAAFVVLMRAAGIPARVVTGYQGGEENPIDGFFAVRQSDAHAWSEVWIEGQGWRRVDPTASVSPARIEQGINSALSPNADQAGGAGQGWSWTEQIRFRWEALNNAWNQYVLGYDADRQRELMERLGWKNIDWRGLASLLGLLAVLLLAILFAWSVHQRPQLDPASRLWHAALRKIRRKGVHFATSDTPSAIYQQVCTNYPAWSEKFAVVAECYLATRYGPPPHEIDRLRAAVAELK